MITPEREFAAADAAFGSRPEIPGPLRTRVSNSYEIVFGDAQSCIQGEAGAQPVFRLRVDDRRALKRFWEGDAFTAAEAFVRGDLDIEGDLVAAVAAHSPRSKGWRSLLTAALLRLSPARLESLFQTRARAARNIRFHYDCSDDFYREFLDSRMVYSCAYFRRPDWTLEQAQLAKLDYICRKLDIRPGERFLDIGCGWGALAIHAASQFGAIATGCTLSRKQHEFALNRVRQNSLEDCVSILDTDYRDLPGSYDKIASVGMFEHVGRHRLASYFRSTASLLKPDGLFLNHGIIRPQLVSDGAETLFLRKRVFPGGELAHLSDVTREAEQAGFEVLDVENLRPHYALTCRAWVQRLQQNAAACLQSAGRARYRTWLLYLAASAHSFEVGESDVHQVLLAKRTSLPRNLTREYMYRSSIR